METRGRSKRSQASQPAPEPTKSRQPAPRRPRVTKAAKPTKAQAAQPAEPDHGDDGIGSDDSQSDGLHTPVPHAAIVRNRRGAAAEGAASPPSIVPAIQSSGDTVDDSASQAAEMEKNQADLEEVRLVSLPDLSKAADDVAGYLRRPDHNNGVSLGLLSIKRDTLFAIRERYVDLRGFPFIQWVPSIDMERDTFEGLPPTQIIGRVNLVAALELIFQFNKDPKCDRLRILEMLDEFFPKLVEPFGYAKPEALARALDIRSLRIIERIEWLKGRRRQMKTEEFGGILARVFCEPFPDMDTPGAIAHALSHGPFKILGVHGESDEKTSTLFSERAKSLLNMFKEDKKNYGLPKLREEYPTGKILDEAFAWALSFYDETAGKSSKGRAADGGPARKKALQHRRQSGHDEFHDANEEPEDVESEDEDDEDDEDDDIESQEIVRAGGPQMPSLLSGTESLRLLEISANTRDQAAPPSAQPQQRATQSRPPPQAPRDYGHSNADLLGSRTAANASEASSSARKRTTRARGAAAEADDNDDDDENDGDDFEEDARPLNTGKRLATATGLQAYKRRRQTPSANEAPSSSAPPARPAAAATASSVPSSGVRPTPEPSQIEALQNINQTKRLLSTQNRLARVSDQDPRARQRVPWSDEDCAVLIELIYSLQASWVLMEKESERFQHPRNQQAYRDKARNLKVDFLSTNAVLPPGFDLVALGTKEVRLLQARGKNPFRRERDLDDEGNAINTEYVPA